MNSTSETRPPKRAGVLLALFVLTMFGMTNTLPQMESTAEKLGALSVPLALLAAACWYAWKDGGRTIRLATAATAMFVFGAFGFGVVKGFKRAQGGREVGQEMTELRKGLAEDLAKDESGRDAARRHNERKDAATARLSKSENADAAALGRVMASIAERTRGPEERLLAALEAVGKDRFLDLALMITGDDFAWQRATAGEYEAAAKACSESFQRLPQEMEAELAASGLAPKLRQSIMKGFRTTWPLSTRACEAHLASATLYVALVAFVEEHRAAIEVDDVGGIVFQSADDQTAYEDLLERAQAADDEVNLAAEALQQAVTNG